MRGWATAVLAAWGAAAVAAAQEGQVLARPETGPVAVSILNEMRQAYRRAEVWLVANGGRAEEGAEGEKDGQRGRCPSQREGDSFPEGLYWVMEGGEGECDFFNAAAELARALDAAGTELVFLADGEPVEWRKAVIHAVVSRQRVDPLTGGGYWAASRLAPAEDKLRATRLALEALSTASGEAF